MFSYEDQNVIVTKILEEYEGPRELPMLLRQPQKVPKAVTDTIAKCLNFKKKERFQHVKDLLNHLTRVRGAGIGESETERRWTPNFGQG